MTVTDLRNVWCADIETTDMRVQADGKWFGSFSAEDGSTEDLLFNPFFLLESEPVVLPSVGVQRGGTFYPSGNDSFYLDMSSTWFGYATSTINDLGMWRPANIGWAPDAPVDWGLTDTRNRPPISESSDGLMSITFNVLRQPGYTLDVGVRSFADDASEMTKMWVNVRRDSVVFVHYDSSSRLKEINFGITGTTWLPSAGVHLWDFFQGEPTTGVISGGDVSYSTSFSQTAGRHIVVGRTGSTSRWQVRPLEASYGDRTVQRKAAMLWRQVAITSSDVTRFLEDDETNNLSVEFNWRPIGAAGIDMKGGDN